MRSYLILLTLLLLASSAESQELRLFGPRAGVGYLTNSGSSSIKDGIHSAFGWQIEIPYTSGELTGYGEGGFMLLAIEQGKVFPHVWGYFGARLGNIGGGLGPAFNTIGVGLGVNAYYQIELETLRIPVGVDFNFIRGTTRTQLFLGFHYK